MSVKTIYEVREFSKLAGHADFVRVQAFDELESDVANHAYGKAAERARMAIGKELTFTTKDGNEATGRVVRAVVELFECKSDGSRRWNGKVVDENEFSAGKRLVLEAAKGDDAPQQRDAVETAST